MDAELLVRLDRVRDRLAEEPLSLAEAAEMAFLSPFHFHRQFARAFGQTPQEFKTERRMEEARRLLLLSDLPVSDVCQAVGFESPGSFVTRFGREFGMPPGQFRNESRRYWALGGIRTYRFVPTCFIRNRKIEEPWPKPPVIA